MEEMLFDEAEMDEVTDSVILALGEIIQAEEERTAIIDPQRGNLRRSQIPSPFLSH